MCCFASRALSGANVTLKEWLRGKHDDYATIFQLTLTNDSEIAGQLTGDHDATIGLYRGQNWWIDVLSDGTAITWCSDD